MFCLFGSVQNTDDHEGNGDDAHVEMRTNKTPQRAPSFHSAYEMASKASETPAGGGCCFLSLHRNPNARLASKTVQILFVPPYPCTAHASVLASPADQRATPFLPKRRHAAPPSRLLAPRPGAGQSRARPSHLSVGKVSASGVSALTLGHTRTSTSLGKSSSPTAWAKGAGGVTVAGVAAAVVEMLTADKKGGGGGSGARR